MSSAVLLSGRIDGDDTKSKGKKEEGSHLYVNDTAIYRRSQGSFIFVRLRACFISIPLTQTYSEGTILLAPSFLSLSESLNIKSLFSPFLVLKIEMWWSLPPPLHLMGKSQWLFRFHLYINKTLQGSSGRETKNLACDNKMPFSSAISTQIHCCFF